MKRAVLVSIGLTACLLEACVFVPRTTQVYDADCQVVAKHMDLEPVQIAYIEGCHGQECSAVLAVFGATAAASAVISGSIVIVGNVVYWFEKQGKCRRAA